MAAEGPKKDKESVPVDNMNIDESILDEDDPVPVKKAVDNTPSIAETLVLLSSQLMALNLYFKRNW